MDGKCFDNREGIRRRNTAVKYYFTNFPEGFGVQELWRIFARWGRVADIYIPQRRNKRGWRFGFVSFLDNHNASQMEWNLNNIWIGTYKLRANESRFDKNHSLKVPEKGVIAQKSKHKHDMNLRQGVSYSAIVKGDAQKEWRPIQRQGSLDDDGGWRGLQFHVGEDDFAWLKSCYVGEVHQVDEVFLLHGKMVEEGFSTIQVTPMGGKLVPLRLLDNEDFSELIKDAGEFFARWFSDLRPWSVNDVPRERESVCVGSWW
ncbi:RNA-binding domain superfamily [Sesbania bispinosa]|nr:RNA-binding domain superfamily [Sesbania bispinosa]